MMLSDCQPQPIAEGQVAQTLVEYLGARSGHFSVRGPVSGQEYRFDATRRRRWVRDEDLARFDAHAEFDVDRGHTIDPLERRLQSLVNGRLAARSEAGTQGYPDEPLPEPAKAELAKRGGRPPVPMQTLQQMWHLRHHALPPLSLDAIASRFLTDDWYAAPKRAASTRLSRFKRKHPELTNETRCPYCR